jgi:RNA polymerase sigma factor (sigma-70 family)
MTSRLVRAGLVLAVLVLVLPLAAGATGGHGKSKDQYRADAAKRMLYATDSSGNLLRFRAKSPDRIASKAITGLPSGVVLKGIDFRPATGDLYALGSDKVVYGVNPWTAIPVAEGPTFESTAAALVGDRIGFDFNPTVDKIRVTSDADDNIRLDPDPGSLLSQDTDLTPAGVTVVGSAYTNSSCAAFANRPTATMLFALDVGASPDQVWLQNPANAGTLMNPVKIGLDLGLDAGFDIGGADNVGYVAGIDKGRPGARLYQVDVEDLVQETFVRLWRSAARYDPTRSSVRTFVFTLARRAAVDLWRRRATLPLELEEPALADVAGNEAYEYLVLRLAVGEALDELSEAHCEVLLLQYCEDLTQAQVAERLQIPLGTVKSRSVHALKALGRGLEEREPE